MKRFLVSLVIALVSLVPLSASHLESIQPLMWGNSVHCTTFSVNESRGYWSTCFHCIKEAQKFMIAGQPATVVLTNEKDDSAILLSGSHAPALKLSPNAPQPGEALTVTGFPFGIVGLLNPTSTTHGEFMNVFSDEDGTWNLYDISAAPGNSGSPVIGRKGVIGTLNFGWSSAGRIGGGTTWQALKMLVDMGYWVR